MKRMLMEGNETSQVLPFDTCYIIYAAFLNDR